MNTILTGKIESVSHKEEKIYDGKSNPPHTIISFLDFREDGELAVTRVKDPNLANKYEKGKEVKLLVSLASVDRKIYYKVIRPL